MKNAARKAGSKSKKSSAKKSAKTKVATPKSPAKAKPVWERDPRLPTAGTVITREHDGKTHEIKVLEKGFEYQGASFRSLSKIAKLVTGTTWNGFLWAGLVKRPTRLVSAAGATPAKEG